VSALDLTGPEDGKDALRARLASAILDLYREAGGLARVHHTHPALYAQARRAFGSWRAAVLAAGLDYRHELEQNLRRGLDQRDQRRRERARPRPAPGAPGT
jgi:hypothetical protein